MGLLCDYIGFSYLRTFAAVFYNVVGARTI